MATRLADILIAEAERPDPPPSLVWLAHALRLADRRVLTAVGLDRIDRYHGTGTDLHDLLPAVLPLAGPVWYEASLTAQQGTALIMGYAAVPADDGLDLGWACYAPAFGRLLGPLGPVRITQTEIRRPPHYSDESWREVRSATGVLLRALLLRL